MIVDRFQSGGPLVLIYLHPEPQPDGISDGLEPFAGPLVDALPALHPVAQGDAA